VNFGTVFNAGLLAATISLMTPILLTALGALSSERAGVLNIGTEGMMLNGAFSAMAVAVTTHNPWAGILAALVVGGLSGLILALWTVTFLANQVVVGIVINLTASGLTSFLYQAYYPQTGGTLIRTPAFGNWSIPLLDRLPAVGPVFVQNPLVFMAFALVLVLTYVLFHTSPGLVIRAVGESARTADTAGINVYLVRYTMACFGGALAGLGGSYLSLVEAHAFQPDMTDGRGYIALAVVMLGKWHPVKALAGAVLFGAADALQFRVQGLSLPIPPLSLTLLPYVVTLLVLIGVVGKVVAPAEDGQAYVKEEA